MSCSDNQPLPGFDVWKGRVPGVLSTWAVQLLKTVNQHDFGYTWTKDYNGQQVVARIDRHTWHYLPDGTLLTNLCWKGITLYKPLPVGADPNDPSIVLDPAAAQPDPDLAVYDTDRTDWTLVGLSAGAILGVATLFALAIKHAGRAATKGRRR